MGRYRIGEFSRIVGLSEKTLRYYHDEGILMPAHIDYGSNYRFYDERSIKTAEIINKLKSFKFSIEEIKTILDTCKDDRQIARYLEHKLEDVKIKIKEYKDIRNKLNVYLKCEKKQKTKINTKIKEIYVEDMLIASIRFKGQYEDEVKQFKKLTERVGKYIKGPVMVMCYGEDPESGQFDIEMAVPVSKEINEGEIDCRIMKGGKALTLQYKGPYENIGQAYKVLIDYFSKHSLELTGPPREIPLRGLWVILPRKPKTLVTEIQFFVK